RFAPGETLVKNARDEAADDDGPAASLEREPRAPIAEPGGQRDWKSRQTPCASHVPPNPVSPTECLRSLPTISFATVVGPHVPNRLITVRLRQWPYACQPRVSQPPIELSIGRGEWRHEGQHAHELAADREHQPIGEAVAIDVGRNLCCGLFA